MTAALAAGEMLGRGIGHYTDQHQTLCITVSTDLPESFLFNCSPEISL